MNRIALTAIATILAVPAQAASLTTTFDSTTRNHGNMFDILIGSQDLRITGFDLNLFNLTFNLEFYFLEGSFVGSEQTAGNWTLLDSISNVGGNGQDNATHWDVTDKTFSAGQRYGFYITATNVPFMAYTAGAGTGTTAAANADLTIFEGVGKQYAFGDTTASRLWNGTIYYDVITPVPLPPAGWLMLVGLGGLGLMARYARRKAQPGA